MCRLVFVNLADGFKEEHALHVAHGATDLNEAHIGLLATAATVHRDGSHALNPVLCVWVVSRSTLLLVWHFGVCGYRLPYLHSVGNMGDDLHSLAQVLALALISKHFAVHLKGKRLFGGERVTQTVACRQLGSWLAYNKIEHPTLPCPS